MPSELARLRNLGPASAEWLAAVGITTKTELEDAGAVLAFKLVQHRFPGTSLNLLWALHGALTDRHWAALPNAEKEKLRDELAVPLEFGKPRGM